MSANIPITLVVSAATHAAAFARLAQRLSEAGESAIIGFDDWREIKEHPSLDDLLALGAALEQLAFPESVRQRVWAALWSQRVREDGAPIGATKGVKLLDAPAVNHELEGAQS